MQHGQARILGLGWKVKYFLIILDFLENIINVKYLFSRAKHDAWARLGSMERTTAMSKYIENLKQIIETMNFSPDVENFMEALGPFYEEVEEEDSSEMSVSNVIEKITTINEEPTMNEMLGSYDISDNNLTDETSDSDFLNENAENLRKEFSESRRGVSLNGLVDFKDNNNCPNKLFEELQKTKESLDEAREMMGKGLEKHQENVELVGSSSLSKRDIDRMLGNLDGFIPRRSESDTGLDVKNQNEEEAMELEADDDIFEDSVESILPEEDGHVQHFDANVDVIELTPSRSPPAAPLHNPQVKMTKFVDVNEEDEILVVTSDSVDDIQIQSQVSPDLVNDENISDNVEFHLAMAVDRLSRDIEHLQARVRSVETILVLRDDNKRKFLWWPFEELAPKTVLFMITWPLISHGLIHLVLAAFKRSSKR